MIRPSIEQDSILRFVAAHIDTWGYSPTYQEIAAYKRTCRLRARQQVNELIRKGYLSRGRKYSARTLTLTLEGFALCLAAKAAA